MDITQEENDQITALLKKLKPGFLPLPIFLEIARLTVTTVVEIVPVRKTKDGNVEVLLTKRDKDDPVWPEMLHVPGTVVRATDTEGSYEDAMQRVLKSELNDTHIKEEPRFVHPFFHTTERGMESAIVYWVEVEDSLQGQFYYVDNLPDTIVKSQIGFIKKAVEYFKNNE